MSDSPRIMLELLTITRTRDPDGERLAYLVTLRAGADPRPIVLVLRPADLSSWDRLALSVSRHLGSSYRVARPSGPADLRVPPELSHLAPGARPPDPAPGKAPGRPQAGTVTFAGEMTPERRAALLGLTPLGRAALRRTGLRGGSE